ncbi:transporter substrate-binding domain-containing protein [Desulforhopalus sp. 52FAK]
MTISYLYQTLKPLSTHLAVILLLTFFSSLTYAAGPEITIAIDTTKPPMQFINKQGEIDGFEIDLIKSMAAESGFTPVFKQIDWQHIFTGLNSGKYDVICASVSITDERRNMFTFTAPYINLAQAVVIRKKSSINRLEDLAGLTVGVKPGTTSLTSAKQIPGVLIQEYSVIKEAMNALSHGDIDAVVCDGPVAAHYISTRQTFPHKLLSLLPNNNQEQYAMVVRKNDKSTLSILNKGISSIRRQLIDIDLQNKWFGALLGAQ